MFLDTHGVAPGEVFQDVLWHRLCDCDVLIMLDTHSYFESRWTAAEFGRALAKGICVLRVGWPGVSASARAKTATNIELEQADFDDTDLLVQEAITRLANQLERARSLGHAVRSVNMYSKIENSTKQIGGTVSSAGLGNSVEIALPGGSELLLVPAIGVPSAGTLQSAEALGDGTSVAVVYDQVGLLPTWQTHLEWLGTRIQTVKWIKASEIAWQLANWEETK
ncbi:MAG: hypothetical protein CBB60_010105 [Armatimonadetes bacterium Cent15-Ar3]|nr:MAG: hypothetical protein CBB60_010105 [Armatimonadetes bacterium Cent15-Ar3]